MHNDAFIIVDFGYVFNYITYIYYILYILVLYSGRAHKVAGLNGRPRAGPRILERAGPGPAETGPNGPKI